MDIHFICSWVLWFQRVGTRESGLPRERVRLLSTSLKPEDEVITNFLKCLSNNSRVFVQPQYQLSYLINSHSFGFVEHNKNVYRVELAERRLTGGRNVCLKVAIQHAWMWVSCVDV